MKSKKKITLPDLSRGQSGMTRVRDIWHVVYYVNSKSVRKSLGTKDKKDAEILRDKFRETLIVAGATLKEKLSPADKFKLKPSRYIYERPPYVFQVGKKVIGYYYTINEAQAAAKKYFSENEE